MPFPRLKKRTQVVDDLPPQSPTEIHHRHEGGAQVKKDAKKLNGFTKHNQPTKLRGFDDDQLQPRTVLNAHEAKETTSVYGRLEIKHSKQHGRFRERRRDVAKADDVPICFSRQVARSRPSVMRAVVRSRTDAGDGRNETTKTLGGGVKVMLTCLCV